MNYKQYYQQTADLIDTINAFDMWLSEFTAVDSHASFAHIVMADYNLSDDHIQWCLDYKKINEYLNDTMINYDGAYHWESDNERENHGYWGLVNGTTLLIEFLEWLLTIPEDERVEATNSYYWR